MSEEQVLLLAEDSPEDVYMMQRAFEARPDAHATSLLVVKDGQQVIEYLKGDGPFADRQQYPLPKVILLDINMPRKNGFEVLAWIRQQPGLRRLMVILLTASNRRVDVERAYELGANYYLTKPTRFDDLVKMVSCLYDWLQLNHFPSLTVPKNTSAERSNV